MLVLFETPAGYAIFKLLDENKLEKIDNLYRDFETPEGASKVLKLKHFEKFADTTEALAATTAAVEGKLCKSLKKTLKKYCTELQDQLAVADAKLGNVIKEKLSLACVSNTSIQELMRCIRSQMDSLLAGFPKKEMTAMALGLAHSLSRYKLKFSPDKIDTMIVQAICLLDDLDKEINNYVMRCREWYGWHFPELGKIISDNLVFVRVVKLIGTRENTGQTDLSDILPEEVEEQVKEAAEISMGTEITTDDITNIQHLCDQVIEITQYRSQLYDYLKTRMMAMAPNLTVLVGELVGARLISSAGSLINLAKHPASTIQILGAEKALFRALKTKRDTPKYGLIYHASLIGQSSTKLKGKMARMLAAKTALATRVDALGEDTSFDLGTEHRARLESRLRLLEEGNLRRISGTGKAKAKFEKYHAKSEVMTYPAAADAILDVKKRHTSESDSKSGLLATKTVDTEEMDGEDVDGVPKKKRKKTKEESDSKSELLTTKMEETVKGRGDDGDGASKKKRKRVKEEEEETMEGESIGEAMGAVSAGEDTIKKKKKKKKAKMELVDAEVELTEADAGVADVVGDKKGDKKKKKRKVKEEPVQGDDGEGETTTKIKDEPAEESTEAPMSEKKKKKKKKITV